MGERPEYHPPEDEGAMKPKKMNRRKFLKIAAGALGTAAAGTVAGDLYIEHAAEQRSEDLSKVSDFLLGKSRERISVFGKDLDYQQFCTLIHDLADPTIETQAALAAQLDSFVYMMEVEDKFAGHLNVLPILEDAEFIREKYLQGILDKIGVEKEQLLLADTFGPGQIHPDTATMIALDKASKLRGGDLISASNLEQLAKGDLPFYKTSDILELRAGGNLVFSFLSFYEGNNLYSRSTGEEIHGNLRFPDERGELQPERTRNPRGFSLAISAYSAGLEAPMVAKAQTYINEMLLTNARFRQRMGETSKLVVDGDIGEGSLAALQKTAAILGFRAFRDLALKPKTMVEQRRQLIALDSWLAAAQKPWQDSINAFLDRRTPSEPQTVRALTESRYSLQIKNYLLLKNFMPENRARRMVLDFMDRRQGEFLNVIDNPEVFQQVTGSRNYEGYINEFERSVESLINFDERFKGYIPTHFQLARQPGADPLNMPARILLAFDLDPRSTSRILIDSE